VSWRLARALDSLRAGVNAKWPNRDKRSDGTIGNAEHASRSSDHNPWVIVGGQGVVRAFDCDVDGIDAGWLAEQLRLAGRAGDYRLTGGGYVIFNRRITASDFSGWRNYTGSNAHTSHVHVSFSRNQAGFDDPAPWRFLGGIAAPGGRMDELSWNDQLTFSKPDRSGTVTYSAAAWLLYANWYTNMIPGLVAGQAKLVGMVTALTELVKQQVAGDEVDMARVERAAERAAERGVQEAVGQIRGIDPGTVGVEK
jgi:hypothetical protein